MRKAVEAALRERGISLEAIAQLVWQLQKPYNRWLKIEQCMESVERVLSKREVQYTIFAGLALDRLAEENGLPDPLQHAVADDDPLFGVDEALGMAITNMYGTIGATNFGYLDKLKPGIIGELHGNEQGKVYTFADDLVAGVVAAAAARVAHNNRSDEDNSGGEKDNCSSE